MGEAGLEQAEFSRTLIDIYQEHQIASFSTTRNLGIHTEIHID